MTLFSRCSQVVVFTNQGGIRTGKVKVADYVHKIEAIAAKLNKGQVGNATCTLHSIWCQRKV